MIIDVTKLREFAGHALAVGGDWLAVFRGAASPTAVIELLTEIDRLRAEVEEANIGRALAHRHHEMARAELAAMAAARNEACEIATRRFIDRQPGARKRIAELRMVGEK